MILPGDIFAKFFSDYKNMMYDSNDARYWLLDTGLKFRLRKTVAVVQLVSVLVDRLRVQLKQEQLNRVTKDETSRATE